MSILLFTLGSQPPDIIAGYVDFQLEIAAYLGYGTDSTLWMTSEVAELGRAVDEAYRYILFPSRLPGGGIPHIWSWQRRVATLTTANGTATYTLPSGFGSMTSRSLTYAPNTGWASVERTSLQIVREKQQYSPGTGRPWLFAVQWAAPAGGEVQRQEITLYPTPDAAYVLSYEYSVLATKLGVIRPYPLGGPPISQLMMEACRAVAEYKKNGARGEAWAVFRENLADAIALDARMLTERTVGPMRPQYTGRGWVSEDQNVRSLTGSVYQGIV